jgi:hypothetical protein
LKINPPVADAIVTTSSTRARARGSSVTAARFTRCAGGSLSCGAIRQNNTPTARLANPGTAKAARQPACSTSTPVVSAAAAMPRLPAQAVDADRRRPAGSARCSSIGMPTG